MARGNNIRNQPFTIIAYLIRHYLRIKQAPSRIRNCLGRLLPESLVIKELTKRIALLEQERVEERQQVEIQKLTFLNMISHEVRTPLNAIIGFTELLKRFSTLTEEQKAGFSAKIWHGSRNLLEVLEKLVEASHFETGNVELVEQWLNLQEIMDEVYHLANHRRRHDKKDAVALLKSSDKAYPEVHLQSDRRRLAQVMQNLVDNALKFTEKGIVEFGYKVVNPNLILFYVKDSGMGIPLNRIDEVFNSFKKINYCFGTENKGLGLGLTISRSIVRLFEGNIWVESNNLGGSTFKFTLPLRHGIAIPGKKTAWDSGKKTILLQPAKELIKNTEAV